MSEMAQRVGTAVHAAFLEQRVDPMGLSTLSGIVPVLDWEQIGKTAIGAMREPTAAMLEAAWAAALAENAREVWEEMIDEAMK